MMLHNVHLHIVFNVCVCVCLPFTFVCGCCCLFFWFFERTLCLCSTFSDLAICWFMTTAFCCFVHQNTRQPSTGLLKFNPIQCNKTPHTITKDGRHQMNIFLRKAEQPQPHIAYVDDLRMWLFEHTFFYIVFFVAHLVWFY